MPHAYHVITRGNNGRTVFADDRDRTAYIDILRDTAEANRLAVNHFVLLDDHVHLLVEVESREKLSAAMQSLNQGYGRHWRRRHTHNGYLWQGRYRRHRIDEPDYLLACGVHMELNPVRAGLARSPEEYRWSSHRFYVSASEWDFVQPSERYLLLGASPMERQACYAGLVSIWHDSCPSRDEVRLHFMRGCPTFHPWIGKG